MKRHLIILSVLCLAAMTLRAQDTTAVRQDVRIRQNYDCGCHQHPVNDYDGLNSLRQRLANPSWDGKVELFRSIGTGMKVEDGKIVPLSKKSESSDTVSPETSSATSVQASDIALHPYLQEHSPGHMSRTPRRSSASTRRRTWLSRKTSVCGSPDQPTPQPDLPRRTRHLRKPGRSMSLPSLRNGECRGTGSRFCRREGRQTTSPSRPTATAA